MGHPRNAIFAFFDNPQAVSKRCSTARNPSHTLGVDRGNQQYEQLIASNTEKQLTIQNLESGMEILRKDLEGEVSNNEKLNNDNNL